MTTQSQIVLYAARRCTRLLVQPRPYLGHQGSTKQGAKMEKTWSYRELEMREVIAKEIESQLLSGDDERDEYDTMFNNGMKFATNIVRGTA